MTPRISSGLSGLFLVILSIVTLQACAAEPNQPVSLVEVSQNPLKYIGKSACWTGQQMEYSVSTDPTGKSETTTTWMAIDKDAHVIPEQTFVAVEDDAKRTAAAEKADKTSGDQSRRIICGKIKSTREVT